MLQELIMECLQLLDILEGLLKFEQPYYQQIILQFKLLIINFTKKFLKEQRPRLNKFVIRFHSDRLDAHTIHIFHYQNVK